MSTSGIHTTAFILGRLRKELEEAGISAELADAMTLDASHGLIREECDGLVVRNA